MTYDILVALDGDKTIAYGITMAGRVVTGLYSSAAISLDKLRLAKLYRAAERRNLEVITIDATAEIAEAMATTWIAQYDLRTSIAFSAKVFEPLIDAAFAASDQAEVERLIALYPDPVGRSFIADRYRQTFGKRLV